ncbi:MAG: hypothetical protein MUE46_14040 [Xanthomonadales bacterium]|jgi:hypothetical protein|nr:hypothetical protein [Xanthomonadales bacterium]
MRLGPILQVIVAVPELGPAVVWADATLGLAVTARGRFPREVAMTLGSPALVDAPCVMLGGQGAPAVLLLVESAALPGSLRGWTGLGLQMPAADDACAVGLGLAWTLSAGPSALIAATLSSADPASARGYYRGLGSGAPVPAAPWTLPLRDGVLRLQVAAPDPVPADARSAGHPLALILARGSAMAELPAPPAHSLGADSEWLLLRESPVLPV